MSGVRLLVGPAARRRPPCGRETGRALPLNLGDVAALPLLILIFAGGELALDEHEAPLGEVLLPVPKDDLVPFRLVDLLAPVVGVALIRSHVQTAYGLSGSGSRPSLPMIITLLRLLIQSPAEGKRNPPA